MNTKQVNSANYEKLYSEFEKCCGSQTWIKAMISSRPFFDDESLHSISDKIWSTVSSKDILEAFSHHPQIGDIVSLKKKFASTANWAGNEQSGTNQASNEILLALKQGNEDYLSKFGFIFIVFAAGKTASEMLNILNQRITNDEAIELHIAASEQNKITHLRLNKLLGDKL